MPINDDTAWITRDNLNVEGFSQIILNEDIWISKEYCQWKMELLWWLVRQENLSSVSEAQLNIMLNRYSDESIPVYFPLILEMVVLFFDELPSATAELSINTLKNKSIRIDYNKYNNLLEKAEELPSHSRSKIVNILNDISPHAPLAKAGAKSKIGNLITPDNITILTALVSSVIGITTVTIKAIKLWIDDRASRKIKIKHKDFELEIQGGISEEELRKRLSVANKIQEELNRENVKIILTKNNE